MTSLDCLDCINVPNGIHIHLLLLRGGAAWTVNCLLDLTGESILGSIELRANGAVLGEGTTNL